MSKHPDHGCPSRRAVLAGTGAVGVTALLAGCQTYGEVAVPPAGAAPAPAGDDGSAPAEPGDAGSAAGEPGDAGSAAGEPGDAGSSAGEPAAGGAAEGGAAEGRAAGALAAVADIPVGGGKIFAAAGVVVTQPTAGTIKAFSAKCTHQGCTVTSISERTIICGCHNSSFDIADGSVTGGPARQPLPEAAVSVDGDSIRLA